MKCAALNADHATRLLERDWKRAEIYGIKVKWEPAKRWTEITPKSLLFVSLGPLVEPDRAHLDLMCGKMNFATSV